MYLADLYHPNKLFSSTLKLFVSTKLYSSTKLSHPTNSCYLLTFIMGGPADKNHVSEPSDDDFSEPDDERLTSLSRGKNSLKKSNKCYFRINEIEDVRRLCGITNGEGRDAGAIGQASPS